MLVACQYGPDDFPPPGLGQESVVVDAPPPSAPTPEGDTLYQLLYEDEYGLEGRAGGQRARMLAWLLSVELDEIQLVELYALCATVEELRREEAEDRSRVGRLEQEHLGPIYKELNALFAKGAAPDAATARLLAARLEAARQRIHELGPLPVHDNEAQIGSRQGDVTHLQRQQRRTAAVISAITRWISTLARKQVLALSSSRYFLRRRAGPLVNPGYYQWLVGSQWDLGDFDLLRHTDSSGERGGMDIAGLWQIEDQRARSDPRLTLFQAAGVMALAITEPGLPAAIEVLQGVRLPDDFTEPLD